MIFEHNKTYFGDCLEVMKIIPEESVDMVLADLPYGTTACKWDSPIDLEKLWVQYKRIIKKNRAIVLFGSQPFTARLVASNFSWFKYSWVWKKNRATGHVHAKNKPMKIHEDICVFSEGNTLHKGQSENRMPYYPQGLKILSGKKRIRNDAGDNTVMSRRKSHRETVITHTGYPTSIINFSIEMNEKRFHDTQKPLSLCEYLIKTYTVDGALVLDNVSGSGTTGLACKNTNRNYIMIDNNRENYLNSIKRVGEAVSLLENVPVESKKSLW